MLFNNSLDSNYDSILNDSDISSINTNISDSSFFEDLNNENNSLGDSTTLTIFKEDESTNESSSFHSSFIEENLSSDIQLINANSSKYQLIIPDLDSNPIYQQLSRKLYNNWQNDRFDSNSPQIITTEIMQIPLGRKRSAYSYKEDVPWVNIEFRKDNIFIKIIGKPYDNYEDYINSIFFEESENSHINNIKLDKIALMTIKKARTIKIMEFLVMEITDLYCGILIIGYKNYNSSDNKKRKKLIRQEADEVIINALKKNTWDIIGLYCSKRNDIYHFEKMKKIEDDLKEFERYNEHISYLQKYENFAINFKTIIEDIYPRGPFIR